MPRSCPRRRAGRRRSARSRSSSRARAPPPRTPRARPAPARARRLLAVVALAVASSSCRSPRRSCSRPTPGRTGTTAGSRRRAREPVRDTPSTPDRSRVRVRRRSTGATRPRSTARRSRSPPSRSPRRAARRRTRRRGSTRRSPALRCCSRLARRRGSPPPARFALAFVGWNPLLAIHFAGGGHNDAWMAALVLGALAFAAAGGDGLAAAVSWALAFLVKWIPLVFLPLRALEARATGRAVSHLALRRGGRAVAGARRRWRYGLDWLRAFGPLAGTPAAETSYALPQPARAARRAARGCARALRRPRSPSRFAWLPARRAAAARGSASPPAAPARAPLPRALVRGLGRPARRRGRTIAARSCSASRSRVYLLPQTRPDLGRRRARRPRRRRCRPTAGRARSCGACDRRVGRGA